MLICMGMIVHCAGYGLVLVGSWNLWSLDLKLDVPVQFTLTTRLL